MIEGFANPAAFALAALAIPIVALYMLKPKRQRKIIPSTFLWRTATTNVSASRPWQKLRPNVLLFLQLLLLASVILVLARPYRQGPAVGGSHLILIVDTSGSMQASDEEPTRLDAARREAAELAGTMKPGELVSVVAAGPRPRVVASSISGMAQINSSLDRLDASHGKADFSEAFLLAESLETPSRPATIALISDGGLSAAEKKLAPPGTVFRGIGQRSDDLGIRTFETGDTSGGYRAFVVVGNSGAKSRTTRISLELDGSPLASSSVTIPAGGSVEKSFEAGTRPGELVARISSDDDLAADNRAYAVLDRARPSRILLVSPGNLFVEKLLAQLPGAKVEVQKAPTEGAGFDLVVYDRVDPPDAIKAPAMFIAPSKPPAGVSVKGEAPKPVINYLASDEPLLEQVDLSEVAIATAQAVEIPRSKTLVGAESTPLIATWNEGALRRVWIGFDLHQSNLVLQVAFPILGDHLLGWLTGSQDETPQYAGEALPLTAAPSATRVGVTTPVGRRYEREAGEPFTETDMAGFYRLEFFEGDRPVGSSSVALSFPPSEQDLSPKEIAASDPDGRPGLLEKGRQPSTLLFLCLVLAFLLAEWWWAHGRPFPTLGGAKA